MSMFTLYQCPKCQEKLELEPLGQKFYRCANNHTYDIAKEGYVNLHLAERKRSRSPGDDVEMIKSRKRFLSKGYYDCLVQGLIRAIEDVQNHRDSSATMHLVDIGCGEGFYLEALNSVFSSWQFAGLDVSKAGVRAAAKRNFHGAFSVASAFELPYLDAVFDYALSIFAPICPEQTARVLNDRGVLLMVGPGAKHLQGLASYIYDKPLEHQGNFSALCNDKRFKLMDVINIESNLTVDGADIFDLLRMTPYYWHTQPCQQESLRTMSELKTSVSFEVQIYQRRVL